MSLIVGIRKREWPQTTLYSLIFAGVTYLILLKFFPWLFSLLDIKPGTDILGIQKALNEISNLGTSVGTAKGKIAFHNVIKLIFLATPISAILGFLAGKMRASKSFRRLFLKHVNRTQNADVWADFHESYPVGPHFITLKDGNVFFGQILMASDTLVGNDRGIIIQQPILFQKYYENAFNQVTPPRVKMPGDVLVFAEQIASISDNKTVLAHLQTAPRVTWHTDLWQKLRRGRVRPPTT